MLQCEIILLRLKSEADGMSAVLDDLQQELLFLVPARLVAVAAWQAWIFRNKCSMCQRRLGAGGIAAAVAVFPGSGADSRWNQGVGYIGNRRISPRDVSGRGAVAQRCGGARPLPRRFRRNAFGLHQSALGAADEPEVALSRLQGLGRRLQAQRHRPHRNRDLARMLSSGKNYGRPVLCSAPSPLWPMPCMRLS